MKASIQFRRDRKAAGREPGRVAAAKRPFAACVRALVGTDDEGGSLAEFALVLPMLLLIVMGIATAGVAMNTYLQLTEAVSVGARTLAAAGGITTDPCSTASSAVFSAAPNLSQSKIAFSYTLNGTGYSGTSCSSSSTSTGAAGNLAAGTTATLTASYPCNLTIFGVNYAPSCTLKAQTAELVQ